jgi:tetrapyrrole methylase family protein/MazG family protein
MTVHVAGLGPAGASLITGETLALIQSGLPVLLRTRRHPAVPELDPTGRWESCDDLYNRASAFADVYEAVARRALDMSRSGDTVFAVPGSPLVAEDGVSLLLRLAAEEGVETRLYPALSYVDLAVARLGLNATQMQVCDALEMRVDAQRPAIIGQVFDRDSAAALKLALLDVYPPSHPVRHLRELGTPSESITETQLSEIDRRPWGYLDSLYVPPLAPEEDICRFDGLHAVVARLHAPGGCPWDREQTHASLRKYLLEECYEVLEAVDAGDPAALAEELGDLLLQVLMHAEVGQREGTFSFADIAEGISRKLIRRHPHVFGDATAGSAAEVHRRWDELKKAEKPRASALEGVPTGLPALAQSQSIQGRARRTGFDWPGIEGPLEKLAEELGEFARAADAEEREAEFGDILFVAAGIGQRLGVDAEQALRGANARFRRRFSEVESLAAARGLALDQIDFEELEALWREAKLRTAAAIANPQGVS